MRIAVLGTGVVGGTIGGKLVQLGHEVMMGSRSAQNEKAAAWVKQSGPRASQGTFADAAKSGELVFSCTNGVGALAALESAGKDNLAGKVLVDISNPLDFSKGFPPTLTVCNTDSLAEQIQRAFPETRVVKTLNTVNATLMVNPGSLAGGEHTMFLCGNDAGARAQVGEMLTGWFGWKHVLDLGDISNARAMEMLLPMWVRLYGKFQSPQFNWHVVR